MKEVPHDFEPKLHNLCCCAICGRFAIDHPDMNGKARWCPKCESWLNGSKAPGTHCGTCMAEIEWKEKPEWME